jgi:hypothetical protein
MRCKGLPREKEGDSVSSLCGELDSAEEFLRARGVQCVRERFRLPLRPELSSSAGFLACAAGGFLLAAGSSTVSFLVSVAGATLLLLDAYGFSPASWLGPKETRSVLVVPGTPSEEKRKAFFFGLPLRCRLTNAGYFSRGEALRRASFAGGLVLAFLFCAVSAGVLLFLLPSLPSLGIIVGVAMLALSAAEWAWPATGKGPQNLAVTWADRLAVPRETAFRPFVLVYSGDGSEVKYFLARHRGPLFRGYGLFLEFSPDAEGQPAASVGEGPFLPYRVDPALFSCVRDAGKANGVPSAWAVTLRYRSPGLFAMARGFRAVTLFRRESPPAPEIPFPGETALAWAAGVAEKATGPETLPNLTEGGE